MVLSINTNKRAALKAAIANLRNIQENWDEDDVEHYGATMSFDELIAELSSISFKTTH